MACRNIFVVPFFVAINVFEPYVIAPALGALSFFASHLVHLYHIHQDRMFLFETL
jgi:hypothetical protein